MNLKGQRVLVTGGSGGYGFGIAQALVAEGCQVWITGRNQDKLERAAEELGVCPLVADAASGGDWDRVLEAMEGKIDVLVNNAGFGGKIAPVSEQTDEDISQVIATNLTAPIMGCARVGKVMMAQRHGTIINISSVCAQYAWPSWSVYTAAKAGLSKFSLGLHTELRPYGVRVICLTPSWGQTGFNQAAHITGASDNPDLASKCMSVQEMGRMVKDLLSLPDHLTVPEMTVMPMIQDISPM